eukprot:TRINITY_DN22892_c0_g1_i1.p1 TRINITY_DN22892_c0_g1~~TRINITY_DN22892_c0_g1_i1.p1  ORF type:complete len:874 (-),score=106.41 TRINITY_DN22892_c0_g1_i1:312-2933(-)
MPSRWLRGRSVNPNLDVIEEAIDAPSNPVVDSSLKPTDLKIENEQFVDVLTQSGTCDVPVLGRWRRQDGKQCSIATGQVSSDVACIDELKTQQEQVDFGRSSGKPARLGDHKDPKTGEKMQGPGISDWGLDLAFDGAEGRHRDPWGPGENQNQHESSDFTRSRAANGRKQPTVRQGQGIEEALSKIGAEAGSRQERPRGEGYCPSGEAAFRECEARLGSVKGEVEKDGRCAQTDGSTVAQRRNLRRVRRRAKEHQDACSEVGGRSVDACEGGCVVLVRDDCRLHDNPALYHASKLHEWVVCLYVHDVDDPSPLPLRGAGLYWRHMSLTHFEKSLHECKGSLIVRRGKYLEEIIDVVVSLQATAVYFNRQLEPWYRQRDVKLEQEIRNMGFGVKSFKGLVLQREPWEVQEARPPPHLLTKYQGAPIAEVRDKDDEQDDLEQGLPHSPGVWSMVEDPLPAVTDFGKCPGHAQSVAIGSLGYGYSAGKGMPPHASMRQYNEKREARLGRRELKRDTINDWAFEIRNFWQFGEKGAFAQLDNFLIEAANGHYQPPERYRADKAWTALLSPYLRFGDLSPRYVYARARQVLPFVYWKPLVRRLFWRDGAYAQLYRWPDSMDISIRKQYENEQWTGSEDALKRWQQGRTGFPLIDAAMRQLWKIGWTPNYLRHVTAQFLIEYLDVSWKKGLQWFDYTLVDSDVAINAMMWQMGGHSGLGAWNFVMHPVYAGKKVDPEGHYVRRWLPELKALPVEYIHCPWEAPCALLLSANVLFGSIYDERIIEDLIKARKTHARNVIAVRRNFPETVQEDGHEILNIAGQRLVLRVRDDLKDNSEDISLEMTPDDAHSSQRRRLAYTRGIHNELLYDETKKHESLHML